MSLYENINKRKKAGTSRSKKKSTISKEAYANMKKGFPKTKKKKKAQHKSIDNSSDVWYNLYIGYNNDLFRHSKQSISETQREPSRFTY